MGSKRCAWTVFFLFTLAPPAWSQSGEPLRVNTFTEGTQEHPSVAVAPDGRFVVVWGSEGQDGSGFGVFGQRFASDGTAAGSELQLHTTTEGDQNRPAVATDANGNFVVVWESDGSDGDATGIVGRRFSANGTALTEEFPVNTHATGAQGTPAVAAAPTGDFLVVWRDEDRGAIFGQSFNPSASPQGAELAVSSDPLGFGPAVSADPDGSFVVVWTTDAGPRDPELIQGRRFDADGVAIGQPFDFRPPIPNLVTEIDVSSHRGGDFTVVWTQADFVFTGIRVGGQVFEETGVPRGETFGYQLAGATSALPNPTVASLPLGRSLVAWYAGREDSAVLLGQRRSGGGGPAGPPFALASPESLDVNVMRSDADEGGNAVVAWDSGADVFAQRVSLDPLGCPTRVALEGAPDDATILGTLYRFRDEVMSRSPRGRSYIRAFYRHAAEGALLLHRHESLRGETARTLRELRPALDALSRGRRIEPTPAQIAAVEALVERFAPHASRPLRRTLERLRRELHEGTLLEAFTSETRR